MREAALGVAAGVAAHRPAQAALLAAQGHLVQAQPVIAARRGAQGFAATLGAQGLLCIFLEALA